MKSRRHRLGNNTGTSLIEIIVAGVLIVGVLIFITRLFPENARAEAMNHQRMIATNLATAKIEDAKKDLFDYLQPTPYSSVYFTSTSCDCSKPVTFSQLPSSYTITTAGTTFGVMWCVNYMNGVPGAWTATCPPPPASNATNTKYIRVEVGWGYLDPATGKYEHTLDQENFETKY